MKTNPLERLGYVLWALSGSLANIGLREIAAVRVSIWRRQDPKNLNESIYLQLPSTVA